MTRRVCAVVAGVVLAGALSACSSDGAGLPIASPSSSPSATADPSTELFDKLQAAAKKVRTVHFEAEMSATDVASGPDGQLYVTGDGDATFSAGKTALLDAKLEVNGNRGEALFAKDGLYLRTAGSNGPGGKPWVRPTQSLATRYKVVLVAFGALGGPAGLEFATALQTGASNVRKRLETTEAGVRVTPYALDLDPAKVSKAAAILQKFAGTGGRLGATMSLDEKGRPVTLYIDRRNGGARFSLSVAYSKYDSPVTITAPPASQVAG